MKQRWVVAGVVAGALAGCAGPAQNPHEPAGTPPASETPLLSAQSVPERGWADQRLPGKRATAYRVARKDGATFVHARSERSASLWRHTLAAAAPAPRQLSFSWWVPSLMPEATVGDRERDDAPARLVLAFDGDHARLSARNHMLFDLAQTLSGERPPFATLMYVWDAKAPVDSVIINGRTDRIRKIVVDSGPSKLGQWRLHRRNVTEDFRRAFGEDPGALLAVAYMTDSDNTQSASEAWYGPVAFD